MDKYFDWLKSKLASMEIEEKKLTHHEPGQRSIYTSDHNK
jgi:hypothetical protein